MILPCTLATENLFSEAPVCDLNGKTHRILPHDYTHTKLLRGLGYAIPAPINRYYDWCGAVERGEPPFKVQKVTCDLLTMFEKSYVLNDMGTGKTRCVLWAWDYLNKMRAARKLLVVGKLSNLTATWLAEVFTCIPHRKAVVLHGSREVRLRRLDDPDAEIFIINHDGVGTIFEQLFDRDDIDTLCIDELSAYRNINQRMKVIRALAKQKHRVWGLTGSPMPNEPVDVWAEASIITPHTVPKYRSHFRDRVMTKVNMIWVPKPGAKDEAFKVLQPAVRFKLSDVVELPETIYRTVDVPMSPKQARVYAKVMNEFCGMVDGHEINAVNAGVAVSKLLQIAGGWVYSKHKQIVELDPKPRLEALTDLIEASENKVIVMVPYRHALMGVQEAIRGAGFSTCLVHGDITQKVRNIIFNDFQNTPRYKVMVAHPGCISHGLTLTAADTVIWYLPTPSLETYEQANARIIRVGQKHKQLILHMQATKVEKRIYSILRRREKAQDEFLQMFERVV